MNKSRRTKLLRLAILAGVSVLCALIAVVNLVMLEVVRGDEFADEANRRLSFTRTIPASRGEILDRSGKVLVTNSTGFAIVADYVTWDREQQDDVILKLCDLVRSDTTAKLKESLPVECRIGMYQYSEKKSSSNFKRLKSFCKELGWSKDIKAAKLIENMTDYFGIDADKYTPEELLRIVGVHYQMSQDMFSVYNPYTFATDLSMSLVTKVMEQHDMLPGVSVQTSTQRRVETSVGGSMIGFVGTMNDEEWKKYEPLGYSMNSMIGKDGAERAFEEQLRGKDGQRTIQSDASGDVVGETVDIEAQPGNSVQLTIDSDLQSVAERSLENRCRSIEGAQGGAAVVLDVNSGEILAMASYPTFNPQTLLEKYDELSKAPLDPLVDRAISSTYAPGSTFKLVTAAAGLETGAIDASTTVYDEGIYRYYDDYQPKCWHYSAYNYGHGTVNLVKAIETSCNYFFFETGRLVGGDKLEKWAHRFGLGDYTGIELSGESKGRAAGPEEREQALENGMASEKWTGGDVLQAAIGQGDNEFTPLQLANYCAALANGGTLYSAHLLKNVLSYDGSEIVESVEPEVLNNIKASEQTWQLIHEGMHEVTGEDGTAAQVFRGYAVDVAGKSGTAQVGEGKQDNGLFISYAPYDKPEIAVCVVIEGGDSGNNVAPVVLDLYNKYFFGKDIAYEQMTDAAEQEQAAEEQQTEEQQTEQESETFTDWFTALFGQ